MFEHLNLNDKRIKNYITEKYGHISGKNSVCVGIRKGFDHPARNAVKKEFYARSVRLLREKLGENLKLYVISDSRDAWKTEYHLQDEYPATEINEPDIIQFYFGMMCNNYILSISSFHLWIAYLGGHGAPHKTTIYPRNTELFSDEYNLKLDNWIGIDKEG